MVHEICITCAPFSIMKENKIMTMLSPFYMTSNIVVNYMSNRLLCDCLNTSAFSCSKWQHDIACNFGTIKTYSPIYGIF